MIQRKWYILLGISVIFLTAVSQKFVAIEDNKQQIIDIQPQEEMTDFVSAGTYPVTITFRDAATGKTKKETIMMTVEKPNTVINGDEAIDAMDIIVSEGTLNKLDDISLRKLTKVHAWHLKTGAQVPITKTTKKKTSDSPYAMEVTFATDNKTSITIHAKEAGTKVIELEESFLTFEGDVMIEVVQKYSVVILTVMITGMSILLFIVLLISSKRVLKMKTLIFDDSK